MFVVFLKMLRSEVEKFLLANASKAVLSKNWEKMSQDVRKRICATSFQNFDKSGNRKAPVKTAGMPPSSVGTPVPTPRNSRTAQSPSSSSVRGTSRISPQQPKVAEPITPRKNSNAETDFSDNQIPPPLPISESSQKSVSTKSIASVRPMQSQPQTPVAPAPPTPTPKTPNVYSSGRTVTNTGTWTRPGKGATPENRNAKQTTAQAQVPTNSRASQPEPANRRRTGTGLLEKERSFDTTSSRVSSAGSGSTYTARRGSVSRNTKPVSSNAPSPRTTNPPPASKPVPVHTVKKHPVVEPSPPPKTSFLTNSEKAKAVSKPKLVFRNQRSNSVSVEPPPHFPLAKELKSSHSRQSSVGSGIGTTPRGSNVAQMSRYTENRNVKPKTNSEKTIKAPASPLPRSRFSHQPTTPSDSRSNISSERSNISTERSNFSTERSNVSEPRKVTVVPSHGTYRISRGRVANVHGKGDSEGQGHARSRGVKSSGGVGMDSSWQMSKSNIEMDSDGIEPKMRTLAEIGRSSTFSKDEPTILGKMAVSVEYEGN